jgi:hypothetical protein
VQELLDFAYYLRERYPLQPPRGSAEVVLWSLEETRDLQFEGDELDDLLREIEATC